jgi:AraC-like DNA-binding protein
MSDPMIHAIDRYSRSMGLRPTPTLDGIAARWDALRAADVDVPGLRYAQWVDWGLLGGVLPPLLTSCADVGTMLATLAEFHPLWGDDEVVVERTGLGTVIVTLRAVDHFDNAEVHPDTLDAFFGILVRVLGELTEPPVKASCLFLKSEPSVDHYQLANRIVSPTSTSYLEFAAHELKTAIRSADASIVQLLRGYAEAQVATDETALVFEVRDHVRSSLESTTLTDAAATFAMSPRSLQERLESLGTSFSEIVDGEKRREAFHLLDDTTIPIAVVARRVGFQSPEGFSRAVRRWSGMTPSQRRNAARS